MYYSINGYESDYGQSLRSFCEEIAEFEAQDNDSFSLDSMYWDGYIEFSDEAKSFVEDFINEVIQEINEEYATREKVRSVPFYR